MSNAPGSAPVSAAVYRPLRRLPPFYTVQPNTQSQAKQLQAWASFLFDAAVTAFKQTGALGISITPHSPAFRSPREVNRVLSAPGARLVLRYLIEQHGGYRCLPLALEDQAGLEEEAEIRALQEEQQRQMLAQRAAYEDDGFEDITGSPAQQQQQSATAAAGSLFLNCDALIIFALPVEKLIGTIQQWHAEDQTSHIFSVSEVADDRDLKKRLQAVMERNGAGEVDLGEAPNFHALSNAAVLETLMTTEHPAMAHLKRPELISGSSGSLGLKFQSS